MLLVYLTASWVLGIILARFLWAQGVIGCGSPPTWAWAVLSALFIGAAVLLRRRKRVRLALVLLLFTLLGGWRYQSHPIEPCFTPDDLAFHNGADEEPAWVIVEGIVDNYPNVGDRSANYELRVHALEKDGTRRDVRGRVLLKAPRYPEFQYGDEVRVSGLLRTPPDYANFSYREYLARQGIHSLIKYPKNIEGLAHRQGGRFRTALFAIRSHASSTINRILPEPQAALLNGILLGIESGIPKPLYDDFNRTGTSHIIVISGFNITIVAGLLAQTLGRLVGKRWAICPIVAGIVIYTLLVGADAAVVRAAVMGILYVVAIRLGRQNTAVVSLSASALLMTAINPLILWDAGFLLSFMSMLGLILFTPAIQGWFERLLSRFLPPEQHRAVVRLLNDALIVTLAAQITTTPLVGVYFGRLSLVSLLSNGLILPVQPPIMICGGIATLAGLVWEPLGRVVAAVPWLFLTYTVAIVEWTALLPFASLDVGALGRPLALIYYALLFGGLGLRQLWQKLDEGTRVPARRGVALAAAVVIPLWLGAAALNGLPDGRLHVWYIGLGDGDATLVQTPSGRRLLIDAGRGEANLARAIEAALPGWGRDLDLLVLTQADKAHMTSLPMLLERFHVLQVLGPEGLSVSAEEHKESADVADVAERDLTSAPSAQSADSLPPLTLELATGISVQLDEGVLLEVLHAPESGDEPDGAVLRLSMGELQLLLPSEIEQETQAGLLASGADLASAVLKTPHAGTGNWPTVEFLAAVRSQLVIVPDDTTYPPQVQERLQALPLVEVDPLETLEVVSDGYRLSVNRRGPTGLR